MKPLFSFGPFTIYFFGLMIAIGALAGFLLFIREVKRRKMNDDLLTNVVMYALLGGIIGARLVYVFVYNPSYYLANPIEIFFIQNGGLSIHGGILGGLLVGYLFLKRYNLPVWETLDIVAPSLILAQGISRIGCDVFGGPIIATFPWGVDVDGELLHPAQAYEFTLDYLLFGYLWLRLKKRSYTGQVFLHYLTVYMVIRGIVEFARVNPVIGGFISVSHVMSLIGIVIGVFLVRYRKQKGTLDKTRPVPKRTCINTGLSVIGLIVFSLLLYYGVQG